MLTDSLVCFILYYLFLILEDTPQAAIVAPEFTITEDSDSIDDWEPESEGAITLPCSSPSPPLDLSRPSTPETIIPSTQVIEQVEHNQKVLQNLIDAEEQNWCVTKQGSSRHPFPTLAKGRKRLYDIGKLEILCLIKGSLTSTMALVSPISPHPEIIRDPDQPMEDDDTSTTHASSFDSSSRAITVTSNPGSVIHSPMSRSHCAQFRVEKNRSRSNSRQHARNTTNQMELLKQQIGLAF